MKKIRKKSIPEMKREIEKFEKRIEEQTLKNQKIKKKNTIVIICTFFMVTAITIGSVICILSGQDKRLEDYRIQTEEQIKEYEQEIEVLQQELNSME